MQGEKHWREGRSFCSFLKAISTLSYHTVPFNESKRETERERREERNERETKRETERERD